MVTQISGYDLAADAVRAMAAEQTIDLLKGQDSGKKGLNELIVQWNEIGLELVKGAERGPTISSRFFALLNGAIRNAIQLSDKSKHPLRRSQSETSTQHAISIAAQELISFVGIDMLADDYLENRWEVSEGTGLGDGNPARFGDDQSAEEQKEYILSLAKSLANETQRNLTYIPDLWKALVNGKNAANEVIAYSLRDGADQSGQYRGDSSYSISHWVKDVSSGPLIDRPVSSDGTPLSNKEINYNFYDEGKWKYADFNPNIALESLGDGYFVSDKGVLSTTKVADQIKVNPAVASGQTRITEKWQSITDWGIFPTVDDGGTQVPLTPHWGNVDVYSYRQTSDYQPGTVTLPYQPNGELNQAFVNEAKELVLLAAGLQDGNEGAANARAIAEYWEYGDESPYPPGHWINLAQDIIQDKEIVLTSQESIDIFFAVSQSVRDAGAIGWKIKYDLDTVRPFTAINQLFFGSTVPDWNGDNLAQVDDREGWNPYQLRRNYTPPFPDIVSGHSAFSFASAVVLRDILGGNYYPYQSEDFVSRFSGANGFDGLAKNGNEETSLKWSYLSEQAEEAGFSRMLGGIHMASGNLEGMKLGIHIGHRVLDRIRLEREGRALGSNVTEVLDERMPELLFGSLQADVLTGIFSGQSTKGEIYGFGGDDIIDYTFTGDTAPERINIFGGRGLDHFRISEHPSSTIVRIADYEAGENIQIAKRSSLNSIEEIKIDAKYTHTGLAYTQVSANNELLFELDGSFGYELLNKMQII